MFGSHLAPHTHYLKGPILSPNSLLYTVRTHQSHSNAQHLQFEQSEAPYQLGQSVLNVWKQSNLVSYRL
jgi:hypothetical protein